MKDLSSNHAALKEQLAQKFAEMQNIMDEKEKVCMQANDAEAEQDSFTNTNIQSLRQHGFIWPDGSSRKYLRHSDYWTTDFTAQFILLCKFQSKIAN